MAFSVTSPLAILLILSLAKYGLADHPCEAEVQSACPDRPGSEVAGCLKDPSEHENPTTISSECTDFVALNVACSEDIVKFCEDNHFTQDTILCLSTWTDQESLSSRCVKVMKWAVPKKDEDETTDELGLSEKDYAEKKAWQAKRKHIREAAIELHKESDAEKEKTRIKMEKMKAENPEEYEFYMKEQEQSKKNRDEARRHERLMSAAKERRARAEAGLPEVDDPTVTTSKSKRSVRQKPQTPNYLPYILGALFCAFIFFNILNHFNGKKEEDEDDKDD